MKKIQKSISILFVTLCIACIWFWMGEPIKADAAIQPSGSDNLQIGLRSKSELVATNSGYMRVYYDGEKICVEYYDNNFVIQSKKTVSMELPLWGGFYAGTNGYYVVEGQNNTAESNTAEVIRVIRYDTNWNRKAAAKITGDEKFGHQVRYPFDVGCVEMAEYNGKLYVVTGHEGYVDPAYNQGHQGFLMIEVNESTMIGRIADADLWHSFAQYIQNKDSWLYVLEQSEGSRCTKLTRYDGNTLNSTSLNVLQYGGSRTSAWAISCYASVDALAVSADHVFCLGTSIDQTKYDEVTSDTPHNIYLTITPTADFSESATTVRWLTDYSSGGKSFLGAKITKINDNRFMISWEEYGTEQTPSLDDGLSSSILHYLFIDGKGNKVSKEYTAAAPLSDCQPIVKGSMVVYYASNANMVNFYTIDANTGAFSKKVFRLAGQNATWNLENGVLTISGTGAIDIDTETHYRYPVSSTKSTYFYSSSDNAWKSVRDNVKKIVIQSGITSIPDNAFAGFSNLREVVIESGLKSIGKKAFYGCEALESITIPASVTSIGEDFLWTGYYWTYDNSHVVQATIYTPAGSYAEKYAKNEGIYYTVTAAQTENTGTVSIGKVKVSGIKSCYTYTGKALKPNVTVKLGNSTLKKNTDYTVTYTNNIRTGKATITIKGRNKYSGTIKKNFIIVPKKAVLSKVTSPKPRTIKLTWKKDSQAIGYQVQYAKNSKFSSGKKTITITRKTTTSKIITKLARKKKYYVRIRSYITINGKKQYGAWSKARRVTVK